MSRKHQIKTTADGASDADKDQPPESSTRLSKWLDCLPEAMIAVDGHGFLIGWNKSAEHMYGWKIDEVIGKPLNDLLRTEYEHTHWDEVARTALEAGNWSGAATQLHRDGRRVPSDASVSAVRDESGALDGFVFIHRDPNERRRAEQAVDKLAERLDLATRSARMGIWDWDIQKNQLVWDEQMYALYGLKPGKFEGAYEAWLQGLHPDDRALSDEISGQAQRGEREYDTEFRVVWPDGSVHWLKANGQVFRDGGGQPLRMVGVNYDITAQKEIEDALRKSEQKYAAVFEKAAIPAALTKMPEGVFVEVNEAFEAVYGYSRQEVIGKTSLEIGMARPEEHAHTVKVIEQQGSITDNYKHIFARSGEARVALINVSRVMIDKGTFAVTTIHDMTERRQAEEALLESKARLDAALANMTDAVFISDVEGNFIEFNDGFATFHKFRDKAECAKTLAEYPGFLEVFMDTGEPAPLEMWAVPRALRGEIGVNVEYSLRRKDTGQSWVGSYSFAPIRDGHGLIVGSVVVGRDITERKQAEDELRRSQEGFARVFDANPAAMAISRLVDGKVIRINAAYTRMLGYEPSDLMGHFAREVNIYVDLHDREMLVSRLRESGGVKEYELLIRARSGEVRTMLINMEAIHFEGEECILAALLDVTERKQAEDELRRSNAELEQFAYVASHDLQEPLRAVAGMMQLLQQRYKGQLDENADEYIGHAVEGATRMQKLINDLLDYSRVDRLGRPFEPTHVEKTLQSALANLEVSIRESGAQITHDPLPTVQADPAQLTQVLQNLIGNAIKFHGEEPPRIHVGAQKIENAWRFAVSDNGIGIAPQYFERVFLVFQRLHTRREYPGTGIGLSLCKKMIERHGGKIWIESQLGQGSTFYFTIPEK